MEYAFTCELALDELERELKPRRVGLHSFVDLSNSTTTLFGSEFHDTFCDIWVSNKSQHVYIRVPETSEWFALTPLFFVGYVKTLDTSVQVIDMHACWRDEFLKLQSLNLRT
jgi:hypothetical protein